MLTIATQSGWAKETGFNTEVQWKQTRLPGGAIYSEVVLATALAAPITFFAMNRWLEAFAYRIVISCATFILVGLLALGVMWLTVAFQSVKAALTDPVKTLRSE